MSMPLRNAASQREGHEERTREDEDRARGGAHRRIRGARRKWHRSGPTWCNSCVISNILGISTLLSIAYCILCWSTSLWTQDSCFVHRQQNLTLCFVAVASHQRSKDCGVRPEKMTSEGLQLWIVVLALGSVAVHGYPSKINVKERVDASAAQVNSLGTY